MDNLTFNKYLDGFKSLSGLLAGVGTLVPAIAYFTLYSPPYLGASSLLIAAVAGATVFFAYYYEPRNAAVAGETPQLVSLARKLLIIAFFLFIAYLVLLRICTALDPREGNVRFQLGLGRFGWSLTELGNKLNDANPNDSMREFMFRGRAFSDEKIVTIWKPWTVYLAGVLNIFIFTSTFALWNFGWALIAKQKALDDSD